eukprot:Opistho-2@262
MDMRDLRISSRDGGRRAVDLGRSRVDDFSIRTVADSAGCCATASPSSSFSFGFPKGSPAAMPICSAFTSAAPLPSDCRRFAPIGGGPPRTAPNATAAAAAWRDAATDLSAVSRADMASLAEERRRGTLSSSPALLAVSVDCPGVRGAVRLAFICDTTSDGRPGPCFPNTGGFLGTSPPSVGPGVPVVDTTGALVGGAADVAGVDGAFAATAGLGAKPGAGFGGVSVAGEDDAVADFGATEGLEATAGGGFDAIGVEPPVSSAGLAAIEGACGADVECGRADTADAASGDVDCGGAAADDCVTGAVVTAFGATAGLVATAGTGLSVGGLLVAGTGLSVAVTVAVTGLSIAVTVAVTGLSIAVTVAVT